MLMLSPFSVNAMRNIHVLLFSLFMTFGMVKLVLQLFKKCWAKAEVANTTRAKVNFFRINHHTIIPTISSYITCCTLDIFLPSNSSACGLYSPP